MSNKIEIVQQFQAYGELNRKLLEDRTFVLCRDIGVTDLQSYVYWSSIEKGKDIFDFSRYDALTKKIKKHGLKWAPFIIMGPNYSTPEWFRESNDSMYFKCLEHGMETKIQSIWNPAIKKYVDNFLRGFSKKYANKGIIGSILLGISGNWGEAIYPETGGFLQHSNGFHTHRGWWCGDDYAISDFRKSMKGIYGSVKEINKSWGTSFKKFDEITYPPFAYTQFRKTFVNSLISNFLPKKLKSLIRKTINFMGKEHVVSHHYNFTSTNPSDSEKARWTDFVEWYIVSMNNWIDFWLRTARKYFKKEKIYIVNGGDGNPMLGVDFALQAKLASKYNAGIRITNQSDDYLKSFSLTRMTSTACRFYGSYFTTEEGSWTGADGVAARIFDAETSGANGIYLKTLIGVDLYDFHGKPLKNEIGTPTEVSRKFRENIGHYKREKPLIKICMLFPESLIIMNPNLINSYNKASMEIRKQVNLDIINERMVEDGALGSYKFLIIMTDAMKRETRKIIDEWVKSGGTLIKISTDNLKIPESVLSELGYSRKEHGFSNDCPSIFRKKILHHNAKKKSINEISR